MKDIIVEIKGLEKTYGKNEAETKAIQGIDLTITREEFVSIVGKSGSGKSTLLNIIGGLERPTSGEVQIEGTNLFDMKDTSRTIFRRKHIGYVFQFFNLIPEMTVYENVRLPLRYRKKRLKKEREHIESILKSLEIEDKKEIRVCDLSGGQQQRVAIARAIVNSPEIILADEPTGALDQETGREVMEIFSKLNQQGKTIIIVTHDPNIAAKCNRIVKMVDGKMQE